MRELLIIVILILIIVIGLNFSLEKATIDQENNIEVISGDMTKIIDCAVKAEKLSNCDTNKSLKEIKVDNTND